MCFEKKIPDQTAATILLHQLLERFSELIKNISDMPKSETFVYFTKITAATWSINKIITVSRALR